MLRGPRARSPCGWTPSQVWKEPSTDPPLGENCRGSLRRRGLLGDSQGAPAGLWFKHPTWSTESKPPKPSPGCVWG